MLVGYGSVSRQLKSVVDQVRAQGIKAGLLRLITLSPFPEKYLAKYVNSVRKIVVVEMSSGQLHYDVKAMVKKDIPVELVFRLGGNHIEEENILKAVV